MRILLVLFSILLSAAAAPSIVRSSLIRRQNPAPFNGPISVTTTSNIPTSLGTITQTCEVTLTPVTVNGVNAVREDKVCKNVLDPSGSNNNNNNNGGGNNENTSSSSSSSTSSSAASEASSTSSSGSNNNNNNSNGGATGNIVNPTDVAVVGTSLVGSSTVAVVSSTATSGAGAGPIVIGQSSTATASAGTGSASAAADNNGTGTSAAESQASSAAPFQIPGKKLQVLPIGLGVFAGISVIALIVVGLVTYERTKYRKTFRQRKLAESGAPMGYGGMAERT